MRCHAFLVAFVFLVFSALRIGQYGDLWHHSPYVFGSFMAFDIAKENEYKVWSLSALATHFSITVDIQRAID